ncbi:hypothetical protein GJ744_006972 [Endocarpon pusillum]|uniref:Uncharacterized protein n=1 Tax=Endocarpon pusillum TaxID=364733 RepID=A0A8H7ANM1_9EURO|nr:hypothetical protein GJ744_006972 [Endocarpon pusillum]
MTSFIQAMSNAFSTIFQFFTSVTQTVLSAFQALISLFGTFIIDVADVSTGLVQFLSKNVLVLLPASAFLIYAVYRQRRFRLPHKSQRMSLLQEKKFN